VRGTFDVDESNNTTQHNRKVIDSTLGYYNTMGYLRKRREKKGRD